MYTWMFGCVMCAFIAGGCALAIVCTKLVEMMCEHKGIIDLLIGDDPMSSFEDTTRAVYVVHY